MTLLERLLLLSKRPTCEQRTKIEQIWLKLAGNNFPAPKKKKCRYSRFEKTVIVFLSDNGGPTGRAGRAANNWPLRGGKVEAFKIWIEKRGNDDNNAGLAGKPVGGRHQDCGLRAPGDFPFDFVRAFDLVFFLICHKSFSFFIAGCVGSSGRARLDACHRLASHTR